MNNFKINNRDIFLWLALAVLLIGTGIMLNWHYSKGVDNTAIQQIMEQMRIKQAADSVSILHMNAVVAQLEQQNKELKNAVLANREILKKINIASINKQYEVSLYTSSITRDYFMDNTGGGFAELVDRDSDTCMVTPIENIKAANVKFVQLEYIMKEREEYIAMTGNLEHNVKNLEQIVTAKDSIINIKDSELQRYDQVIATYDEQVKKKDKKIKSSKIKTWVAAGLGAAGIVLISVLN